MFETTLKRISQLGKRIVAPGVLLMSGSLNLYLQQPALSQTLVAIHSGDLICYMQTGDGRTINLSQLCGSSGSILSSIDQQFLETYQQFLKKRLSASPLVQATLSQVQQSPQTTIQRAKAVCTAIRSGERANPVLSSSSSIDADLINTMALEYYCPDLDE